MYDHLSKLGCWIWQQMYNQSGLSESKLVNKCIVKRCLANQNKCFVNRLIDSTVSSEKSRIFMLPSTASEVRNCIGITLQQYWNKVGVTNNSYSGSEHLAFNQEKWQKPSNRPYGRISVWKDNTVLVIKLQFLVHLI